MDRVWAWLVKVPSGHLSLPSWAGVSLPQKHNGSGLLRCDPCEGGEHQVVGARVQVAGCMGPVVSFSSCNGKKEGPVFSCLATANRGKLSFTAVPCACNGLPTGCQATVPPQWRERPVVPLFFFSSMVELGPGA